MSSASLSAKALHKVYRLQIAIREMEQQVKTNPAKTSALEELKRMLEEWTKYEP